VRPTIVFMPGLLCDASVFAPQIAALSPFTEIRVADFTRDDTIPAMAASMLAAIPGRLTLIGFSMGGRVALQVMRQAPERIERLCLMDTGATPAKPQEPASRGELLRLAHEKGMDALAANWLPPMLHIDREADPALIEPLTGMVKRADPALHDRQINALLTRPDARPVLATIRCPTLVMVGRQDRWATLAQHEEMAAAIPGAELAVIEDAGHFVTLERPEAVTRVLARWLGFPLAEAA
jgi:pimeloyl-ACP methyl ester carboxylesterase